MICPNCKSENELTWKRYVSSPLGRHICDQCQSKFRMIHSIKYHLCILGIWCVSGVPAFAIAIYYGASFSVAFALYWIVGLSVGFPLDKKIDNTWRGTKLRD